jgi:hypothetical protein
MKVRCGVFANNQVAFDYRGVHEFETNTHGFDIEDEAEKARASGDIEDEEYLLAETEILQLMKELAADFKEAT